jgi:putative aldouronate transport system substrate-binding protein
MRKKGFLKLLVSLILVLSMIAACSSNNGGGSSSGGNSSGSSGGSSGGGNSSDAKVETVVFAMPTFNRVPDDLSAIEDAINKITVEKANVKIDLQLYGVFDYAQKVNLALQSGEQLDLFTSPGQFANYASKQQLYPLDDLIEQYGGDMMKILEQDFGEGLLKATTMNGKIYGIPANKGMALPLNFVYNADMLAELGFSADDVNSIHDLPPIYDALMAKYPDVVPFGPVNVNPSTTGIMQWIRGTHKVDMLTDTSGVGVVIGDSGKVVNLYETQEFKDAIMMMREWYNKGYLQKDAATAMSPFSEMISAGRGFSFMAGYGGMQAHIQLSSQMGKNIHMKRIAPFYFDTSATNAVVWMMNATTNVPEAAMKLLNLVYSDEQVLNTLLWGIEGRDYIKVDEHHVRFPDGKNADTVDYTAYISSGIVGSESLQYQYEGIDWSDIELKVRENKETPRSPYFGFIFDQSSVKVEMSAISNVIDQYLPGLETGSLDPETTIPKFIQALNDAGAQNVIKAKQEQLDAWLAAQ